MRYKWPALPSAAPQTSLGAAIGARGRNIIRTKRRAICSLSVVCAGRVTSMPRPVKCTHSTGSASGSTSSAMLLPFLFAAGVVASGPAAGAYDLATRTVYVAPEEYPAGHKYAEYYDSLTHRFGELRRTDG